MNARQRRKLQRDRKRRTVKVHVSLSDASYRELVHSPVLFLRSLKGPISSGKYSLRDD